MEKPKFRLQRPKFESAARKAATDKYEAAVNAQDASLAGISALALAYRSYGSVLLAEDKAADPARYRNG